MKNRLSAEAPMPLKTTLQEDAQHIKILTLLLLDEAATGKIGISAEDLERNVTGFRRKWESE